MKTLIQFIAGVLLVSLVALSVHAQELSGAWKLVSQNGKPFADESIKIYGDGYFMFAVYDNTGKFIRAGGGNYSIAHKQYTEVHDFFTADSTRVRQPLTYSFAVKKDELTLEATVQGVKQKETWKKVDEAASALSGAWRFGARVDDDGVAGQRRGGTSPRQTLKILSGKYFQWAAFNYETKQFMGSGGGVYTLADGKYTENIQFFARDNSRSGMSLTFDCRLEGTDWYHKGKGTTGNPVSEVWERIK